MSKFLDQTGLSHFWSKIKTLLAGKADKTALENVTDLVNDFNGDIANLYNTKADEDHIHPNSVKIETPNGEVAQIIAIDEEDGGYSLETGRFHTTGDISTEGSMYTEGTIHTREVNFPIFDENGDNVGGIALYPSIDEEDVPNLYVDSSIGVDGNILAHGEVEANMARVDEVDFKMCDNDGNEASSVLMYGYYDENDERHLIVEEANLDVTGSIKAERHITISAPNGDNVYLFAQPGGEEYGEKYLPSIETGRFHSTSDISSEGKVIADGKIYEEGTPLSDKYASKTDLEDVRDALVTCDATVGGLVDSVSDLEDNTEKMTNHYIGHPEGGEYQYLGAITGAIFIKVPVITNGGKVSFDVNISCNRYQSDAIYRVCGYMPGSGNWGNTGAFCITSLQNQKDGIANASSLLWNLVVSFGYQNGEYGVYIGNLQTVFHEPVITISNVSVYAWAVRDTANLRKNWEVSIVSSYPIPINSIVPNAALYTPKRTDYTLDEIGMPKSSINAPFTVQPFMSSTRAMRLFGLPADQVIIEQSIDGGATWTSADVTDWTKAQIFSQTKLGSIKIPLKNGSKSCDCMLRVTITGMKYNVPEGTAETEKYNYWNSNYVASTERYCSLDFGYFWISANADKMYIEHQVATGANPNNWVVDGSLQLAQGWTGGDYVKFNGNVFGSGTTQIHGYWNHRFIFRPQASDGSFDDSKLNQSYLTTQQAVYEISCYGQNCWTPANEMMKSDRPYTVNNSNQTTFTGDVVVQGAMYPQGYVVPQTDVYGQGKIYAKGGFVFTDQSDADKKLLTADGWWKHVDTFATADHNHTYDNLEVQTLYATGTISTDGNISAEGDLLYNGGDSVKQAIEHLDHSISDINQEISDLSSVVSHKFKMVGRTSLTKNGYVDLSAFLAIYDELMIIVRVESTASVTVGPSNTTSASSSGFLCSKALSGTTYAKIMVNKTDEGYMAWDIGGTLGWSNSTAYKYLRNYTTGTVTMSVVVHGR